MIAKKNKIKFIYYILPLSITLDFLYFFVPSETEFISSPLAILKALTIYSYILYCHVFKRNFSLIKHWHIYIFFFYVVLLLPFSSNVVVSLKMTAQIFASLLLFPIAYNQVSDIYDLKKLTGTIIFLMSILVLNFGISKIFGLGISTYTRGDDFYTGGFEDSWNNFTYLLLVFPLVFLFIKSKPKKVLAVVLAIAVLIILIISLKRIAVTGVIFGGLVYFILLENKKNYLKKVTLVFASAVILLMAFPQFYELFMYRYDFRKDRGRFTENFYESETRFIETVYVWNNILSFDDPVKSFFGLEAFNSAGSYSYGMYGKRNLHIDYNLIAYTNGLLGLLIYIIIYLHLFFSFRKVTKDMPNNRLNNELKAIYITLLITSLFTSLGGQMYHITYRLIVFVFLGAILKILTLIKNQRLPAETLQI